MPFISKFGVVWLSTGYNCNNRCIWCYAASNFNENKTKQFEEIMEEPVVKLLNDLEVKKVILIGGEPTLYPKIQNLVQRLSSAKISSAIVTNGRRFKEINFVKSLKDANLQYATFSIEGPSAQIHDLTTQVKGSFDESIQGLKNSCDLGIKTATNTLISSKNIFCLNQIVENLSKYKLNSINFNICGVCVSEEKNNNYLVTPREAISAFEDAYKIAKTKGIKARLITPMPICNFPMAEELKENKAISGGPCQLVHWTNFVIDYNGDIVPCTHLTGYPMFNLFENEKVLSKEKFLDKYNNSQDLAYQFRNKMSRYASTKCERNKCKEKCSGGCPLFWTKFDPEKEINGAKK